MKRARWHADCRVKGGVGCNVLIVKRFLLFRNSHIYKHSGHTHHPVLMSGAMAPKSPKRKLQKMLLLLIHIFALNLYNKTMKILAKILKSTILNVISNYIEIMCKIVFILQLTNVPQQTETMQEQETEQVLNFTVVSTSQAKKAAPRFTCSCYQRALVNQ